MLVCKQASEAAEQMTLGAPMPCAAAEQPAAPRIKPLVQAIERSATDDDTPVAKTVRERA